MTAVIKWAVSSSIEFQGRVVASKLKAWLECIPDSADINVDVRHGDARDPSYTTIVATWSSDG